MSKYFISTNQLAEYSQATEASKKRIIKQQKVPNKFLIPWYQKAKGAIKKFFSNTSDYAPIDKAISELIARTPTNKRQEIDKAVSVQALQELKQVRIPAALKHLDYEVISIEERSIMINNVDIIVAPEIVIRAKRKGEMFYGGIKIHISKGKPFSLFQAQYVATTVYRLLRKKIAKKEEHVDPKLCFCLDVFSGKLISPPADIDKEISKISILCNEIKSYWAA
jgi:hypothetical protein